MLLVEIGGEKANHIVPAEFVRPGNQRAVTCDLIVLDGLRRADNGRVQHILVSDLASHVVGFGDQPVDSRAFDTLGFLAEKLEDLVKPGDLLFGFSEVILKSLGQVSVGRFLDQLGQGFTIRFSA